MLGVAAGEILAEAAAEEPPPLFNVNWKSAGCKLAAASVNFPIANTCPHYNKW